MGFSNSQIQDLVNTTIGLFEQATAAQTQERQNYAGFTEGWDIPGDREVPDDAFYWTVRMRSHNVTTKIQLFDTVIPTVPQVTEKARLFRYDSNAPMTWDIKETMFMGTKQKIVDYVKLRWDATMEGDNRSWDNKFFRARPSNTATHNDDVVGLAEWFPKLGVGVEDADGGFNGQTIVFQDGTTSTTCANIDASLVANANWRSWVGTVPTTFNTQTVRAIKRGLNFIKFSGQKYEVRELKKSIPGATVFLNQDDYEKLEDLRDNGAYADAEMELSPEKAIKIRGAKIVRTPAIDTETAQPIYCKVHAHTYCKTASQRWRRMTPDITEANSPDIRTRHLQSSGLLVCTNRRAGGFCLHRVRTA